VSRSGPGGRNHWSMKNLMVDGDGLVVGRSREAKAVATSRGGERGNFGLRAFNVWSCKVPDDTYTMVLLTGNRRSV